MKEEESSFDSRSGSDVPQYKPSAKTPQFRIVDVLGLLTIAALICALFVPILRVTNPEAKKSAAIVLVIQVVVTLVVSVSMFQRRWNSLKNAGARIGIGYRSEIKWKYWPEVFSLMSLAFAAMVSIGLSIVLGFMLERGHGRLIMFLFSIFAKCSFLLNGKPKVELGQSNYFLSPFFSGLVISRIGLTSLSSLKSCKLLFTGRRGQKLFSISVSISS
jgi:hypothetical protein